MFSHSMLSELLSGTDEPCVSLFLPTSPRSSSTQDAALHLRRLVRDAQKQLVAHGAHPAASDEILAPAEALIADRNFWQHQEYGLALFLSPAGMTRVSVGQELSPIAVVGPHFEVMPLMPHLTPDVEFLVLCVSEAEATLYRGNLEGFGALALNNAPSSLDDVVTDEDYENPVLASPPARPNVGHLSMSHSQVYGMAPPEWRAMVQARYAQRVATAVTSLPGFRTSPLILIADTEFAGQLAPLVSPSAVDTTHPASLSEAERRDLAWSLVSPTITSSAQNVLERLHQALATGGNATDVPAELGLAAAEGRIETLCLSTSVPDASLSLTVRETVNHGGTVVWVGTTEAAPAQGAGALLRY